MVPTSVVDLSRSMPIIEQNGHVRFDVSDDIRHEGGSAAAASPVPVSQVEASLPVAIAHYSPPEQ